MKPILGAILLGCATTAVAQSAAPTTSAVPVSAAAIASARPVIDKLWPLGTYRRLMETTMGPMMDAMMDQMLGMRGRDIVPGGLPNSEQARAQAGDKSIGELASAEDPYFRERMRRMSSVMSAELVPLMDKLEPSVREGMVRIYAKKFSAAQLADLDTFLATPTGQAYAREWLTSFMDPEIVKGMQAFMPEMMKAMPGIMAKVQEATKDLPPPPKRKTP